ncbi:MAG: F0F1 ATP synthase subunit A [Planctomycetes bacterium]|nr:F0F1 ATP synthase subunit A [Planctomycetota bacterium]
MLASGSFILDHINDSPWKDCVVTLPGGMKITLMSSAIAMMIISAIVVLLIILPTVRKWKQRPSGMQNFLEAIVLFIREQVARPALHHRTDTFLPFLLTIFVFVLTMNLLGMVPLKTVSEMVGLKDYPVGGAATGVLAVCGGLATISMCIMMVGALQQTAVRFHKHHESAPVAVCYLLSPLLWIYSLCPPMEWKMKLALGWLLTPLELIGFFAKCFALMIRLFANMTAGHALIAAMLMFVMMGVQSFADSSSYSVFAIAPLSMLMALMGSVLDMLVAVLQAYIFTFLSAMFIGMYMDPAH